MDPNEMTPTQYFVQKILNKQPIEPMDEVPLGPVSYTHLTLPTNSRV